MKIVSIFVTCLFSFHYENEADNEYDRLMDLWTDVDYLHKFANKNNVKDVYGFVRDILENAEEIQDLLDKIWKNSQTFGQYFQPLQDSEKGSRILAFQKGKIRRNQLRLYALKLDSNCFVITGGAIKMSQKMQDHPDTNEELEKLKRARGHLNHNGVFDEDSFFELLNEQ